MERSQGREGRGAENKGTLELLGPVNQEEKKIFDAG